MIKIVPVKTKVKTVIGGIEAIIKAVCIYDGWIQYQIGYFLNGNYQEVWINRYEFEVNTDNPKKAGLVNYDKREFENEVPLLEIPL